MKRKSKREEKKKKPPSSPNKKKKETPPSSPNKKLKRSLSKLGVTFNLITQKFLMLWRMQQKRVRTQHLL